MSKNIAHLDDVRDALDFSQKFFGVMSKEQVLLQQLVHPLNDLGARRNLAVFLKAGCPAFAAQDATAIKPVVEKPTLVVVKQTMLGMMLGTIPVTVYGIGERLTIAQVLRVLMNLADDAPLDAVEELVKDRKHPISEAQCKKMLDKQAKFFRREKDGKDFGLLDNEWANLVLVQYPDTIAFERVSWYHRRGEWLFQRFSLVDVNAVIPVGRLVVSNSETSNL